jgi:hypothetical protein
MAPIPTPPAGPQGPLDGPDGPDSLNAYVGLAADGAEQQARERGWSTVRSLPPGAIITMEYLAGRLNFEDKEGVVTRCWKG